MLIVAGDWNARPGPVDTTTRFILDRFAVDTRCATGDRLVNFQHSLPTPTTPPRDMVLQRRTYQEPNRPHSSAVPLCLLRDRLSGLQWGRKRGRKCGRKRGRKRGAENGAENVARVMQWFEFAYAYSFEGKQLDEDASPVDEWRELIDAIAALPRHI